MKNSVMAALAVVLASSITVAPGAQAQQWTDCSKVEASKREACIRNLPTVKGGVPIGGKPAEPTTAAAAKDAKKADAPAKDAKKPVAAVKDTKAAAPAKVAAVNPSSPCAKVEGGKREACLSRAATSKGPGWAAFEKRYASIEKASKSKKK